MICDGGPKLSYLGGQTRLYTGDAIDPLVGLHYPNRTTPPASIELTIEAPAIALGQLVTQAGLRTPQVSVDAVDAFQATLQSIARESGGELPVSTTTTKVPLFDDGLHNDGALEPDGIYNNRLEDLTRVEGTYQFRAVATYGEGCRSTREALWSIHVEPGIDPDRSEVEIVDVTDQPGGRRGVLVMVPRDRYGNPLGPGRKDRFTVAPLPGVTLDDVVRDRKDGSYGVSVSWDDTVIDRPGVLVTQPERPGVPLRPSAPPATPVPRPDCTDAASQLLDCLGLDDPEVKRIRVKRVCLEVDLKEQDCQQKPEC